MSKHFKLLQTIQETSWAEVKPKKSLFVQYEVLHLAFRAEAKILQLIQAKA